VHNWACRQGRINERETHQGKVATTRPPKRLAQLRSSLISDPLPAEQGRQIEKKLSPNLLQKTVKLSTNPPHFRKLFLHYKNINFSQEIGR